MFTSIYHHLLCGLSQSYREKKRHVGWAIIPWDFWPNNLLDEWAHGRVWMSVLKIP